MNLIPPCLVPAVEATVSWIPYSFAISKTCQNAKSTARENIVWLNEQYGLVPERWIIIGQIAMSVLAPFAAAIVTIILLPPLAVKITLPFIVMGVSFLAAFYGLPEEPPENGLPAPSHVEDFAGDHSHTDNQRSLYE